MRGRDPLVLVATAAGAAGLVLLFRGLADGVPLVFWGTEAEVTARESGRRLVLVAGVVIVAAAVLLGRRRGAPHGAGAAAVGVGTVAVALLLPQTALAWIVFLVLAPVALGAWLSALAPPLRERDRPLQ